MPLHLSKWERRAGSDRDMFGNAALNLCRVARSVDGVRSARFYWANADTVGFAVDAEPGAWGTGSAAPPNADQAKAMFALSDLARQTSAETWGEAGAGEAMYRSAR